MPRKITQKRKLKGGSPRKKTAKTPSPKITVRPKSPKRTARPKSLLNLGKAKQTIFKEANQKVRDAYEGDLSQECLNILEIQRQEILDFLNSLEVELKRLEVNKKIEVKELERIINASETYARESTKREKEWKPAELALRLSEYIGKKINYGSIMEVVRKFLREQGEPLGLGTYYNLQRKAETTYENKPHEEGSNEEKNKFGRPKKLVEAGVYTHTPLTTSSRNPRRKLDLSGSTPYENESV